MQGACALSPNATSVRKGMTCLPLFVDGQVTGPRTGWVGVGNRHSTRQRPDKGTCMGGREGGS